MREPIHYGSNQQAECGADNSATGLTTTLDKSLVTCVTCLGWLPLIETASVEVEFTDGEAAEAAADAREDR